MSTVEAWSRRGPVRPSAQGEGGGAQQRDATKTVLRKRVHVGQQRRPGEQFDEQRVILEDVEDTGAFLAMDLVAVGRNLRWPDSLVSGGISGAATSNGGIERGE